MEAIKIGRARDQRSDSVSSGMLWRFANCEFDEARWVLRVQHEPVELEAKPLEILRTLLHSAPKVVSKEEIFKAVWPEATVVDGSLSTAISKLRKAIGDSDSSIIVNVPRMGYRLASSVSREGENPPGAVQTAMPTSPRSTRLHWRWALVALACLTVIGIGVEIRHIFKSRTGVMPERISAVVVLPFENTSQDHSLDYLGLALSAEIENTLTYIPHLAVRGARKGTAVGDVIEAGKQVGADAVVIGHYYRDAERLKITIEAVEVADRRMLWHKSLDCPANDLVAMRKQIKNNAQTGLAQALGASQSPGELSSSPSNQESYDLYLRSTAIPFETGPNLEAISMLERAVSLDQNFAPAWNALGRRYYVESHFSNGDSLARERWVSSTERAYRLDPNSIPANSALVVIRVEQGKLGEAYILAKEMLHRRPDSAWAHFSASYVLRYAGMMPEASKECDNALWLDPHDFTWRSCALVFMALGKYRKAADFAALDSATDWNNGIMIDILLREGNVDGAAKLDLPNIPQWNTYKMLQACARNDSREEIAAMATTVQGSDDPELDYLSATHLAYCGMTDQAISLLSDAVAHNYCAVSWLENDALLGAVRQSPKFAELISDARTCQSRFLSERDFQKKNEGLNTKSN